VSEVISGKSYGVKMKTSVSINDLGFLIKKWKRKEMLKRKMFLCFLAATVASQWLEFLQQDLSGRLSGAHFTYLKKIPQRGFSG
jgi:hypothetical protein